MSTVTVCPVPIVIVPAVESGVSVDAIQLAALCEDSQVEVELQFPEAFERKESVASDVSVATCKMSCEPVICKVAIVPAASPLPPMVKLDGAEPTTEPVDPFEINT